MFTFKNNNIYANRQVKNTDTGGPSGVVSTSSTTMPSGRQGAPSATAGATALKKLKFHKRKEEMKARTENLPT